MPALLVQKLAGYKYDADDFLSWYCKFEDLDFASKKTSKVITLKSRFYTVTAYYVWLIFVASGLVVATFKPIYGIVTVLFSPLILAGSLYVMAYTQSMLTPKKKKKKINTSSKDISK